jgi:hypothetical protein
MSCEFKNILSAVLDISQQCWRAVRRKMCLCIIRTSEGDREVTSNFLCGGGMDGGGMDVLHSRLPDRFAYYYLA